MRVLLILLGATGVAHSQPYPTSADTPYHVFYEHVKSGKAIQVAFNGARGPRHINVWDHRVPQGIYWCYLGDDGTPMCRLVPVHPDECKESPTLATNRWSALRK